MTDDNEQRSTSNQAHPGICERLVGPLSDYERGVWTPGPGERVRIATASGEELQGTFVRTSNDGRALVFIVELFLADPTLRLLHPYRWDQLAPAPPRDCVCPVCRCPMCGSNKRSCECDVEAGATLESGEGR